MRDTIRKLSKLIKPLSKRKESLIKQHKLKNEMSLYSSRAALTRDSVYFLSHFCLQGIAKEPLLLIVLLMLYSGRAHDNVVKNLRLVRLVTGEWQLRLYTPWNMPSGSDSDCDSTSNMFISLPSEFTETFFQLKAKLCETYITIQTENKLLTNEIGLDSEQTSEELNSSLLGILPKNDVIRAEQITLSRVKNSFSLYAHLSELSDYEVSFISADELESNANLYYGLINRNHVQSKFDNVIKLIEKGKLKPTKVPRPDEYCAVGSNFSICTNELQNFFKELELQYLANAGIDMDVYKKFNAITEFCVAYLSLCTLHRPTYTPFGSIDSFALDAGTVCILDKGASSFRVLPLSSVARHLVASYIEYLSEFRGLVGRDNPSLKIEIDSILHGKSALFSSVSVKQKRLLKFNYTFTKQTNSASQVKNNFARHYIPTILYNGGFSRDDIKMLLGHTSAYSKLHEFSSSPSNTVQKMTDFIDRHLLLPSESGGLGIRVPRELNANH
ncbi:hypothetical protein [Paraglaciecola aestuariivivens]